MCPIVPTFTCGFERSNFSLPMPLYPFRQTFSCRPGIADREKAHFALVVGVNLEITLPQLQCHGFNQLQITLAGQRLVRYRQRAIQRYGLLAKQSALQNALVIANPKLGASRTIKEDFHIPRGKGRVDPLVQLGVSRQILNGNYCLLKHSSRPSFSALARGSFSPSFHFQLFTPATKT